MCVGSQRRRLAVLGSFHEVTAPRRLVQTWEYEGEPGQVNLDVLSFTDLGDDRSRLHGLAVFLTVARRDALLGELDQARDVGFERLDALLASA